MHSISSHLAKQKPVTNVLYGVVLALAGYSAIGYVAEPHTDKLSCVEGASFTISKTGVRTETGTGMHCQAAQ